MAKDFIQELNFAIDYIASCRDTHLGPYDELDRPVYEVFENPDVTWEEVIGDEQFHKDCVEGYDRIIAFLQDIKYGRY